MSSISPHITRQTEHLVTTGKIEEKIKRMPANKLIASLSSVNTEWNEDNGTSKNN